MRTAGHTPAFTVVVTAHGKLVSTIESGNERQTPAPALDRNTNRLTSQPTA
jgi:hypothetical protein